MQARKRRTQGGFTVVELLVALLIGLFLLGGLLTLVQDNRRTFASQNQLSQLQDAERMAMTIITDVVQSAGYYPDPTTNSATLVMPANGTFAAAGQAVFGTYSGAAPGDTISVRYATNPGDTIVNCIGQSNTGGAVTTYTNTFSVRKWSARLHHERHRLQHHRHHAHGQFHRRRGHQHEHSLWRHDGQQPQQRRYLLHGGQCTELEQRHLGAGHADIHQPDVHGAGGGAGSTVPTTLTFQRVITVMSQAGI